MIHFLSFLSRLVGESAARIASSNTFFNPVWINAEHSKYFAAFISLAICKLCVYEIGAIFFWANFWIVSGSSLRSSLVPIKMMGVPGAWWLISGYHFKKLINKPSYLISTRITFVFTFSNEAGFTNEKQTKKTSVCG